jgi:16S rRNA (adenine(1408)-N(1))-methyltransferase
MEAIWGKRTYTIDAASLSARLEAYPNVLIDIGTGDGYYVQHIARSRPAWFAIGIDACRENLRDASRKAPDNALYVIASAQALPRELYGLAAWITINFPWGSLLTGLLAGDAGLLGGLAALARPIATLEVRLNGGALAEAGWTLITGGGQARRVLGANEWLVEACAPMDARALRACPTTWARRLACGRDPRALYLRALRSTTALPLGKAMTTDCPARAEVS